MPSNSESVRIEAFLVLHAAGWSDWRAATALGAALSTVEKWRTSRNLGKKRRGNKKIADGVARQMYDQGENDADIAKRFKVDKTAVLLWRRRHGLPSHAPVRRLSRSERNGICRMLRQRASRGQVAEQFGVSLATVQRYRERMKTERVRPTGLTNIAVQKHVREDGKISRRIELAIGHSIPDDVRLDAIGDLYADVLEGKVGAQFIEKVAPSYRNRAMELSGNGWGRRSLDDPLGEDWTLGDTLEDETALEEIELAAEAAWRWNDN